MATRNTMPTRNTTRLGLWSAVAGAALWISVHSGGGGLQPTAEAQENAKPTHDSQQAHKSHAHKSHAQGAGDLKPVESDPHHFMEYYNRPAFLRLKQALSGEPNSEQEWEAVTSDALVLAEAGNLLMMRPPEDQAAEWKSHAAALRAAGSELYQAAEKKEFAPARKAYETMVSQCNDCHDHFHRGKPNLKL